MAVIAYIPLGSWLYLASVFFPPGQGSVRGVVPAYYVAAAMMAAGALARRAPVRPGRSVVAGFSAGLVLGGLVRATFAVQGAPADSSIIVVLCLADAIFAPVGAFLSRELSVARSRRRAPRADPGKRPSP